MATTETLNIVITTKARGDGAEKAKSGLDDLTNAAKAFAGALAVQQVVKYTAELAQLGAESERQSTALNNLAGAAGTSGDAIIGAMREASDFTIDRMAAMQAANRAMVLDVADSPEEFERLTKVATALGRAMGQDATKSIDDFVTAAGRQSRLIADNLGLMVDAETANRRYAEANNISVDAMDDAAKKQAFLTEMLRQGEAKMIDLGDAALDNAGKIEQAGATWETFRSIVGEGVSAALLGTAGDLNSVNRALDEHGVKITWIIEKGIGWAAQNTLLGQSISMFTRSVETNDRAVVSAAEGQRLLSGEYERALPLQRSLATIAEDSAGAHAQYQAALASTEAAQAASAAASLQLEQAELAAAAAAGEATRSQQALAASLKDATDAQIAQAAIGQLGAALAEGDITLEQYNTAVGQVQLTFGLATEESLAMAEGILGLTANLADGTLSAEGYDEALLGLIGTTDDAATKTNDLARELAALPEKKTITIEYRRVTTGSVPSGAPSGPAPSAPAAPSAPTGSTGLVQSAFVSPTAPTVVPSRLATLGNSGGGGGVNIGPVYIQGESPEVIWRKLEQYARLKGKSGWRQLGR